MNAPPGKRTAPAKAPLRTYSTTTDANPTTLAAQINSEHELAAGKAQQALEHARRAGEYLIQAKASVGHGKWLPWLATNCPAVHEKKAERYMKLARGWDAIAAKSDNLSDLTVTSALQLLVPSDLQSLLDHDAAWVSVYGGGMHVLTPSTQHPGYAYVDNVNASEGWTDIARRPIKFDGLHLFYGGSTWQRHTALRGFDNFIRTCLPERISDCTAFGILEEVAATA